MGVDKPWSSGYPTTVDDTSSDFVTVTDNVDDVLASHPNSMASAIIALEKENTGYKDNVIFTAASNEAETTLSVERVIGSVLFDGAAVYHMIAHARFIGVFQNGAATGNARVRVYDLGPPGAPVYPPVLRSTMSISDTDGGKIIKTQKVLTLTASPGTNSDEIHNSLRLYEFRVFLDSPTAGDAMVVHWAGFSLGVTQ